MTGPHAPFLPQSQGWMFPEELEFLYERASSGGYGGLLEIGCWKGLSTSAIAQGGYTVCIDPFLPWGPSETGTFGEFIANMKEMHLLGRLTILKGRSREILPFLTPGYRLILVDGCHDYEDVLFDLLHSWALLERGGVLAIDDYGISDWPGVKKAADEMMKVLENRYVLSDAGRGKLFYLVKA